MRDPNMLNEVYTDDANIITIDSLPEYDLADWDLLDATDFRKYITTVEKSIRGSYEYRQMIAYLRENFDMNKCSFYQNVTNEQTTNIKIEIHHEPITLYDLCLIVYNKRSFFHESVSEELVAKEVMFIHYKLLVGLIPLAETVHELVHNKYLFIPTDKVFGHYKEFVELYKDFIMPEQLETLNKIEKCTDACNNLEYKDILKKKFIYIDTSGAYSIPKYEDVIELMNGRMTEIREERNAPMFNPDSI